MIALLVDLRASATEATDAKKGWSTEAHLSFRASARTSLTCPEDAQGLQAETEEQKQYGIPCSGARREIVAWFGKSNPGKLILAGTPDHLSTSAPLDSSTT